jgi:beta-galactosidase
MQTVKPATQASSAAMEAPHFASGSFDLAQAGDTFLDISSLGKGVLWINGHALGRFWNIGPQVTLYLPGPWLKQGRNEVVIFDLLPAKTAPKLVGRVKPILDGPTPTYADDPERRKKPAANAEFGPKLDVPGATPTPVPPPKE